MIEWLSTHGKKSVGLGQSALAAVLELIRGANASVVGASNKPTDTEEVRRFLTQTTFESAGGDSSATNQQAPA